MLGRASGNFKSKVPWTAIMEDVGKYIDPVYLPKGIKFNDPSHIIYTDCRAILQYWLNRQAQGLSPNDIFQFKAYQDTTTKLVQSALFSMPVLSLDPRAKKSKSKAPAKVPDDDSDEDGYATPEHCYWELVDAQYGAGPRTKHNSSTRAGDRDKGGESEVDSEEEQPRPARPTALTRRRSQALFSSDEEQEPASGNGPGPDPLPASSPRNTPVPASSEAVPSRKRKRAPEVDPSNITADRRTRTLTEKARGKSRKPEESPPKRGQMAKKDVRDTLPKGKKVAPGKRAGNKKKQ